MSVRIEDLSLNVLHCPANGVFHDGVPMEWGDVDAILAQRQFSNLESVSVRHTEYMSSTEYPLEWFFDRLPLCHKRGILRMLEASGFLSHSNDYE
jgi:hypothetical protein